MYDTENNEYVAYTDSTFRVVQNPPPARILRITIPLTTYKIAAIKILLNPIRIRGRNQIDAIGISDSEIPIEATIHLPIPNNNTQETTTVVSTEKLSDAVNSKYNEIMPVISADGKTLFFDRQMHPDNTVGEFVNDDIWFAEINEDQTWKPAQRLPKPLNNENHNYVCSISPDGNSMLVANDYNFEANSNKTNGGASITRKNRRHVAKSRKINYRKLL